MLKKLNIYKKTIFLMLIVGLVPFVVAMFIVNSKTSKILIEQATTSIKAIHDAKAELVEKAIVDQKTSVKAFSELVILKDAVNVLIDYHKKMGLSSKESYPVDSSEYKNIYNDIYGKIKNFSRDHGWDDVYMICWKHGHVMFSLSKGDDLGENLNYGKLKGSVLYGIWKKVKEKQDVIIADFEYYSPKKKQMGFIGAPIKDDNGNFIAIVAVPIPYKSYMKAVNVRKGLGKTGESYIVGVGKDGKTYLRSKRVVKKGDIGDPKSDKVIEKCLFKGEKGFEEKVGSTGNIEYVYYTPLDINGLRWGMFTTIKKDEVLEPVAHIRRILLVLLIVFTIIITLISLYSAKDLTKPIYTMIKRAKDIAEGEADLTARIQVDSHDELGELAGWINKFIERIQELISEVKSTVQSVSSASVELSSTSEELSATSEEQAQQSQSVAASMEELTATIEDNQKMILDSSSKFDEMRDVANKGSEIIGKTITSVENIAEKSAELAGMINEFGESAKGIGEILVVINEIADQTNLLALNAAIEAARAGEAGRGFAVVADEIRKLAERTAKSIKEIEEIIKQIQKRADGAISAMEQSLHEVEAGVKLAEDSKEMMQKILQTSEEVRQITVSISTASEEQAATVREVNLNIQNIAQASEQAKIGIVQIAETSADLARQAENLRELVEKFKTE